MSMTPPTIFANANCFLPTQDVTGSVTIASARCIAVDKGTSLSRSSIDCESNSVSPDLIELHGHNLEHSQTTPPMVDLPHGITILAHESEPACNEITIVIYSLWAGAALVNFMKLVLAVRSKLADVIEKMPQQVASRISDHLYPQADETLS